MRVTNDFVVARKLAELRRQRAALQQMYESLRAQAARTKDDYEAAALLYHALREIRFAGKPVHPDICVYELVFRSGQQVQAYTSGSRHH